MPLSKQMFVVEGWAYTPPEEGTHPEHPIYIPVEPPPDSGLSPEHPIYFPVTPAHPIVLPPEGGTEPPSDVHPEHPIYLPVDPPADSPHPEHPIYFPVYPAHPIELPDVPPISELPPDKLEALKAFLFGNLPPFNPPDYPAPVSR